MTTHMNLTKVTITGADNNSDIEKMLALSMYYPFLEWGILLSKSLHGTPRYPSKEWLSKMHDSWRCFKYWNLSAHLCGMWVDQIALGNWDDVLMNVDLDMYSRIQFNCLYGEGFFDMTKMLEGLDVVKEKQLIFKHVHHNVMLAVREAGFDAVEVYDESHGCGHLCKAWPESSGTLTGYAGGLSPLNLDEELLKIRRASGPYPFWIDAETRLRTDCELDLKKVNRFLSIAEEHRHSSYSLKDAIEAADNAITTFS